jgi:hypothetical protein
VTAVGQSVREPSRRGKQILDSGMCVNRERHACRGAHELVERFEGSYVRWHEEGCSQQRSQLSALAPWAQCSAGLGW